MQPREYCETILALFLSLRVTSSRVCRRTARLSKCLAGTCYARWTRKMCEYIDRTGRLSPKDMNKRKNPTSNIRWKTIVKQGEYEVIAGVIRIMFKVIFGIIDPFSRLYLIFISFYFIL